MIIAVDFDGTICKGKFPAIEGLIDGAKDTINNLYNEGHYIIINTCRSGEQLLEAINWMLQEGIKFHRVNDNHPEQSAIYNNNCRKIYAHVYVDDKQVGGLPDWSDVREYILKKDNEWKENQ